MTTAQKPRTYSVASNPPSMSIAQAKANFSSLITGVEKKHTPVTISRRGVPVALVIPVPGSTKPKLRDSMAGTGRELGDIVSPLGMEWTVRDFEEDHDEP